MIDEHDKDTAYCRRLGHHVPFGFCRRENEGRPCRLVFDCWWEKFDVESFLRENLTPEAFEALKNAPKPDKMNSLLAIIEQAQERLSKEEKQDDEDQD